MNKIKFHHLLNTISLATIVSLLLIVGCDDPRKGEVSRWVKDRWTIIEIDGCEYISWGRGFTHKGNCKNPIHIYNKIAEKESK